MFLILFNSTAGVFVEYIVVHKILNQHNYVYVKEQTCYIFVIKPLTENIPYLFNIITYIYITALVHSKQSRLVLCSGIQKINNPDMC